MVTPAKLSVLAAFLLACAAPASAAETGKDLVDGLCNACHDFRSRVGNGYSPTGWRTVVRMMINQGAPIPPEAAPILIEYLAKTYPEQGKPNGAVVPGPEHVNFRYWPALTPGSRPHDPLAARDGSIWYTGQLANVLARLDPRTGQIREFYLKTAHSGPHGLTEDKAGNIWFTANSAGYIGKLDPLTEAITEYPLPDPNARDPHTLIFDESGILWFTVQAANRVGRLDPRTGEIKLLTPPTANARPYGIQINARGIPFFVEFGSNKIASINPETLEIREYPLPNPAARPRRLALTPEGIVFYSDFARGYLGRLDPATGKAVEWPSPSGPRSEPYGISVINGVVWYSESGATPNTVVRFDPRTEAFQSWALPGGGNIVRNTSVTADGNLVLANSLINGVTLVEIGR